MIQCLNLKKSFNGRLVLDGLNLTIPGQEVTVVIGRSGEGKSVFLKHLVGLIKPDQGDILVDGQDITRARGEELKRIKDKFGIVFQGGALFDSLRVFDNVAFPLRHKTTFSEAEIKDQVEELLSQINLADHKERYPAEISGGMAKRVALARALITHPDIMLFDEPVTGLDPVMKNTILDLIEAAHQRYHFTGVVVSHNIPDIFQLADQVAMLHQGRIIIATKPEEIALSDDHRVRHFLSGGRNES